MSNITLPLVDLYGPIREKLVVVERIFDEELTSEIPFVNSLCERVRSYRGKMLRPALLLLTAEAAGGIQGDHLSLAAVVEMVHMATLVHDDVLDGADERRGVAPVNSVHGNVAAVLLGDYLISHAYHLCSGLASQHAARRIGATTNVVCEGELLQNQHRHDPQLSVALYFDIIRRKTGELTATSCELGAEYAGADGGLVRAMRSYGLSAGIAFQIIDDVLDVVGDRRKVRKTLGRDLTLGKPTLPTIHCLAHADGGVADTLRKVLSGTATCTRDQLGRWLSATGSVEYALSVANEYVGDALRGLDQLPPSDAKSSLAAMAEFIVQRQF